MTTSNPLARNRSLIIASLAAVTVIIAAVSSYGAVETAIRVAPGVLNLQNNGQVVTIHTDLPYSAVVGATVTLNGIEIDWWKADNRGNFVAKFVIGDVKDIVEVGECELTLTGETKDGGSFTGTALIQVIDQSGK